MEYLTIKEMAEKLGIKPNTVKQRLFLRGIKVVKIRTIREGLYSPQALDAISDFGPKGFQPKQKSDTD
jgi:hypothetical protein